MSYASFKLSKEGSIFGLSIVLAHLCTVLHNDVTSCERVKVLLPHVCNVLVTCNITNTIGKRYFIFYSNLL